MAIVQLNGEGNGFSIEEYDRIEIMSNGWAKCVNNPNEENENRIQYPPHSIVRVEGEVTYYER